MTTTIDCDTCVVRGLACHDCVVTVLLGPPPELSFDEEDRALLGALAEGGLVPPLRLVTAADAPVLDADALPDAGHDRRPDAATA